MFAWGGSGGEGNYAASTRSIQQLLFGSDLDVTRVGSVESQNFRNTPERSHEGVDSIPEYERDQSRNRLHCAEINGLVKTESAVRFGFKLEWLLGSRRARLTIVGGRHTPSPTSSTMAPVGSGELPLGTKPGSEEGGCPHFSSRMPIPNRGGGW